MALEGRTDRNEKTMIEKTAHIYYMKGEKKIRLRLPEGGNWVRPFLHNALSAQHSVAWDKQERVWLISKSPDNFDMVLEALRGKYRKVVTEVEHSRQGVCTTKCQQAKRQHCECVCAGKGHGGNGAYVPVRGDVLVRDESQVVTSYYGPLETAQPVVVQAEPENRGRPLMSFKEVLATYGEPPEMTGADLIELRAMLGEREFNEYFG